MKVTLDKKHVNDYHIAADSEWLETNGLGGYSSCTVSGANTRRYHGLLVASLKPPVDRMVLLSRLEETIVLNDGRRFELFSNQFPGIVSPLGYLYIKKFERNIFPEFTYEFEGYAIKKTISAIHGENTVIITYEVLKANKDFYLDLRPFIAYRDFHSLTRANDSLRWDYTLNKDHFSINPYEGLPDLHISVPNSKFTYFPGWYHDFEYLVELSRGLDFKEDLFSHGYFSVKLGAGAKIHITCSIEDTSKKDPAALVAAEETRRKELFKKLSVNDDFTQLMALNADQFIVQRGTNLRTIIAGYHWFSDWGRDTMIALPGICLVTGRFEEAKKILKAFALSTNMGMIPNRFPDDGETPEYNTVDATLWFFVAIYQYFKYSKDKEFIKVELMPVLEDIIEWHIKGTRYNIMVDHEDGLLYSGEEGVQLTWMDAKVGNWVVTPRLGKPVEINALWYNVLKIMEFLNKEFGKKTEAALYGQKALAVKESFESVFWNKENKCLYDCVGDYINDPSIRPNQIFALSLPFPLMADAEARKILKVVENKLLTPFGLRSLAPDDIHYKGIYTGNQWSRDGAYHQGTVWSWLLGPYYTAKVRLDGEEGKKKVEKHIEKLKTHFKTAGIGTVSEIFDGDEPFTPNGCIAQAWSVGEVLRAYVEDVKGV